MDRNVPDSALNPELISNLMSPGARLQLSQLTVLDSVDSTNSALQKLPAREQHAHVILAESQSKGRGQRARQWYSPPGCNIYLSLGWQVTIGKHHLSNIPLLTAVCTCRALARAGLQKHGIKWPNDILVSGRKLAGILVETQAAAGGPATAVIGLGVNVNMPPGSPQQQEADRSIDREWTDLTSELGGAEPVSRNAVTALLLEELIEGLRNWQDTGFASFRADWEARDLLSGRKVELQHRDSVIAGVVRGIDEAGGLLLERSESVSAKAPEVFHAGEVRVFHD